MHRLPGAGTSAGGHSRVSGELWKDKGPGPLLNQHPLVHTNPILQAQASGRSSSILGHSHLRDTTPAVHSESPHERGEGRGSGCRGCKVPLVPRDQVGKGRTSAWMVSSQSVPPCGHHPHPSTRPWACTLMPWPQQLLPDQQWLFLSGFSRQTSSSRKPCQMYSLAHRHMASTC